MKKFKEHSSTAVFTTKFVFDNKDITTVYHEEEDGAWQFFSDDPFDNYEDVARIVSLGEIIALDSSLLELAEMPEGYYAHRHSRQDNWTIARMEEPTE